MMGAAALASMAVNAASLTVAGSYTLVNDGAYHTVISADGTKVLYSSEDYTGLSMIDFGNREVVVISEERGAGFAPQFASDGETVYYRCEGTIGRLRAKNVMAYDVCADRTAEVAPMTRDEKCLDAYMDGCMVSARSDYREIVVTEGSDEHRLNPIDGAHSYMWVRLSPDRKRLLFVEPFKGAFVCNLDGSGLVSLGKGAFPAWLGNEFVLLTRCRDNGEIITQSNVVAVEVSTGKVSEITPPDSMTEEASGSIAAGKIVCSGIDGRMVVVEISVTE